MVRLDRGESIGGPFNTYELLAMPNDEAVRVSGMYAAAVVRAATGIPLVAIAGKLHVVTDDDAVWQCALRAQAAIAGAVGLGVGVCVLPSVPRPFGIRAVGAWAPTDGTARGAQGRS